MQVVLAPDNRLRVKTKPIKKITPKLLQTFKEMVKLTKTFDDPEGVGLASTQIGEDGQYFVAIQDNGTFKTYINPKIIKYSQRKKVYFEGCLSIPSTWGETERSFWVDVSYQDQTFKQINERLTGLQAWIFQHEVDHLNGILFIDRVLEQKGKLYKVVGKDRTGADVFEEVTL